MLAKQYGWLAREAYAGVWWLGAETLDTLLPGLIDLGSYFIPRLKSIADREVAARNALKHIETGFSKPWLLIYDNVPRPEAIEGWVPREGAHVLVTSRWSNWYGKAKPLTLELFSRDEAVAFLLERTKRKDKAGAARLAEALGDLPLALDQAAAYCWSAHVSFDEYLAERTVLLKQKEPTAGATPESVWSTFTLALKRVTAGDPRTNTAPCPEAERLMGLLSFMAADNVPLDLIGKDMMTSIERGKAVAALAAVSLITRVTFADETFGVSVRRLVQEVMRGRLETGGELFAAVAREQRKGEEDDDNDYGRTLGMALNATVEAWRATNPVADLPTKAQLLRRAVLAPHAVSVLESVLRGRKALRFAANLADWLGEWERKHGNRASARTRFGQSQKIVEDLFSESPDDPKIPRNLMLTLCKQADMDVEEGNRQAARDAFARSVAICEKLTKDHPDVPDFQRLLTVTIERLADMDMEEGNRQAARDAFERSLAVSEMLAKDHPDVPELRRGPTFVIERLAGIYLEEGNRQAARDAFARSLAICEKLANDHPDVPDFQRGLTFPIERLANIDLAEGKLADARKGFERSLVIREKLVEDHPDLPSYQRRLTSPIEGLANIDLAEGKRADARKGFDRSVVICEKLINDHPDEPSYRVDLASPIERLANIDLAEGKLADARKGFEVLLGIRKKLAADHPDAPEFQRDLGTAVQAIGAADICEGRIASAITGYRAALDTARMVAYCVVPGSSMFSGGPIVAS